MASKSSANVLATFGQNVLKVLHIFVAVAHMNSNNNVVFKGSCLHSEPRPNRSSKSRQVLQRDINGAALQTESDGRRNRRYSDLKRTYP